MALQIKNWAKFQHFKDRRPPWVKLYRDILDDREWHKLDGDSAKLLISLWLIGSEDSGNLPSIDDLAFRLRLDEKHVKKCLKNLEHWLISERYQDDINLSQKNSVAEQFDTATDIEVPLRDREETETETEIDKETTSLSPQQAVNCPQAKVLSLWAKHLPHLAQPRTWEGNRKAVLRSRWIQASKPSEYSPNGYHDEASGLEWWDGFFSYIANDTKLSNGFESAGRSWKPDLEWVLNATNFQKIIDGKYDK